MITKSKEKRKTRTWWATFSQWDKFCYIIGWLFGWGNLLFWAWQLINYFDPEHRGEYFFDEPFHQRVRGWGIIMMVVFSMLIAWMLLTDFFA